MNLTEHVMPINDVDYCWSEQRTDLQGNRFRIYVGVCKCTARFEGLDTGQVARLFVQHVEQEARR